MAGAYLGHRRKEGAPNPTNPRGANFYTVEFRPDDLYPEDFEIFHIVIQPGPGGNFVAYIDDIPYSTAARGDINEYDPNQAMPVRRGQYVYLHWNVGVGTRPMAFIYSRRLSAI